MGWELQLECWWRDRWPFGVGATIRTLRHNGFKETCHPWTRISCIILFLSTCPTSHGRMLDPPTPTWMPHVKWEDARTPILTTYLTPITYGGCEACPTSHGNMPTCPHPLPTCPVSHGKMLGTPTPTTYLSPITHRRCCHPHTHHLRVPITYGRRPGPPHPPPMWPHHIRKMPSFPHPGTCVWAPTHPSVTASQVDVQKVQTWFK